MLLDENFVEEEEFAPTKATHEARKRVILKRLGYGEDGKLIKKIKFTKGLATSEIINDKKEILRQKLELKTAKIVLGPRFEA